MDGTWSYGDGNILGVLDGRGVYSHPVLNRKLQQHSSLIRRLALDKELEGHGGCVNSVAWNSRGSLLISGSDDTRINIWSYAKRSLLHSVDTGHTANIFCTKFIPETSDELVASGAGDAEVRIFNLCRSNESVPEKAALFQCHSKRVKKLLVEAGNPNVVWSASEDGTLRQHDFREISSCPPPGASNQECRNVLLDLRCGMKKSLADSPRLCLALKSCDISSTRLHQILVGGSDAFGRLYDRRMLPTLSTCSSVRKPPLCVRYFCPVHLSERRRSSLHLTHVTFSPNGEEVLLSYSGEHVYLMDVNVGDNSTVRYSADDIPNRMYFSPVTKEIKVSSSMKATFSNKFGERNDASGKEIATFKSLVDTAEKCLEEDSNFLDGIEACNRVLTEKFLYIGPLVRHNLLCLRASLLLKRKWKNDVYMAMRDCNEAQHLDLLSFRAHFHMAEALMQLGKHKEALNYAEAAHHLDPSNFEAAERVRSINKLIAEDESKKDESKKNKERTAKLGTQPGRLRMLNNILFRTEINSVTSEEGHQLERDDSDYEEEMELDFETSMSGDDGRYAEPNVVRGSLNLRFHHREHSNEDNCDTNDSCQSPSFSQHERLCQPGIAVDMKQRYVGHCNVGTDIKQASFLGQLGEYVASGSDDGRMFIWEKRTGRLIKILTGDEAVVNCIQCHPFDCAVATSGIDNTIKIWTPHAQKPSLVSGGAAGPECADVLSVIEDNQQKLSRRHDVILPFEFFERFRMHEFAEGSFHPFECAQS